MKSTITRLLVAAMLLIGLLGATAAPTGAANSTPFWLYDGLNGTGCVKSFTFLSGQHLDMGAVSCSGSFDNRVESVKFSCSAPPAAGDYLKLWLGHNHVGSWTIVTYSAAACSSGVSITNFPSAYRNTTSDIDAVD